MSAGAWQTRAIALPDESAVGEARRQARLAAIELGLDETAREHAAILATELARNAVLHGGGGELLVNALPAAPPALELLALDRGGGIADVRRAMQDGYSTAGTAGHGLGAVARIASAHDVYSRPGGGTAVRAQVGGDGAERALHGAVCVALAGEAECGDAWAVHRGAGRELFFVADGLGHGAAAADAARAAVAAFERAAPRWGQAARILDDVHAALRATRGAAVALGSVDAAGPGVLRWAGIGNISGSIVGAGKARKTVSLAGTAGHQVRRIQEFEYEWPEGALLVMHSDGIDTHWDLDAEPGLASCGPPLVAAVIFRDHARRRDDATVLVARRGAR